MSFVIVDCRKRPRVLCNVCYFYNVLLISMFVDDPHPVVVDSAMEQKEEEEELEEEIMKVQMSMHSVVVEKLCVNEVILSNIEI